MPIQLIIKLCKLTVQRLYRGRISSIISLLWKIHWTISPFFLVIFPNPWARSFSKYPSKYECSLNFTFLYPESFLILLLKSLKLDWLKLMSVIFYLSSLPNLFLSEALFDFKWVIIERDLDNLRHSAVEFIYCAEIVFLSFKVSKDWS